MNDTGLRHGGDAALDEMLRRGLGAPRDREGFADSVRESIRARGGEVSDRRVHTESRLLRAAAGLLPPVMTGPFVAPAGAKLGWKALPLLVAVPLAMLVGVAALAWFGLRAIGSPDASRAAQARARFQENVAWWARAPVVYPAVTLGTAALWWLWPAEALLLMGAGCIVYLTLVVRGLGRAGVASREHVGTACVIALLVLAGPAASAGSALDDPRAAFAVRAFAPLILLLGSLACLLVARPARLGVILIIATPVTVLLLALASKPLLDRLRAPAGEQRVQDVVDGGDHALYSVADPVATSGLDADLTPLDALLRRELAQRHANQFVLRAAALAGRVPAGALEGQRRARIDERLLAAPPAPVADWVLGSPAFVAFVESSTLSGAERERAARNLAASWPEPDDWDALADARLIAWAIDRLGHPELVDASRTHLHRLLRETLGTCPDGTRGFVRGKSDDGQRLFADEADWAAAVLIDRVGPPADADVEAVRSAVARRLFEIADHERSSPRHVQLLATQRLLGTRAPDPVGTIFAWRHVIAVLVLVVFCVVAVARAPKMPARNSRPSTLPG